MKKVISFFRIPPKPSRFIFILLCVWVVILSSLYTTLSLLRHTHYQSGAFDLGIYDQALWQYSRFQFPYNTIKERFILADHLTLTLPLLAPLYWIWNDVRSVLIFQAFWITISALPVYGIAQVRKLPQFTSFTVAFLYSLFYGIQFAVFFDFHPIIIGTGLLAWTIYFYESGRRTLYFLFLVLTLLSQENMGLALAGVGCIYLFQKRYRFTGLLYILGGVTVSFLAVLLIHYLSPQGYEYWPSLESNPINIGNKLFDSPEKQLVWFYTFSWFSFIPIGSPGGILAVFIDLSQYFLPSKQFGHMITPFLHHRAILGIFTALATLDVLKRVKKQRLVLGISIILLISTFAQQYIFHFPLNKLSKRAYWQREQWMEHNDALIRLVPSEASVATAQNLVPHLSHRNYIYLIWPRQLEFSENSPCKQKLCWWLEFSGKPDYLVADLRKDQWVTQLLTTSDNFISAVESMKKSGVLTEEKRIGSAVLFKIKHQ